MTITLSSGVNQGQDMGHAYSLKELDWHDHHHSPANKLDFHLHYYKINCNLVPKSSYHFVFVAAVLNVFSWGFGYKRFLQH